MEKNAKTLDFCHACMFVYVGRNGSCRYNRRSGWRTVKRMELYHAQRDRLMDGEKEFRFISMNGSNLTYMPAPEWHRPDPWEQEDVFRSLQQMGGTVVRLYTFTIKGGTANGDQPSHVTGLRQYNEDYFRDLDHVLRLANEYHIRVIIPFIDTWEHVGGIKQFAGFRGKTAGEFYTDPELKEDYKHLVSYVLNRTNTYTGIKYKDDKAILAWETGNELYPTDAWTQEMSAYIKSMDSNHIVMDGRYGISQASLEDPNVDIVSNHYYESGGADYALRAAADRNLSLGKKRLLSGSLDTRTGQISPERLMRRSLTVHPEPCYGR